MKIRYPILVFGVAVVALVYHDVIKVPQGWNLWIAYAFFAVTACALFMLLFRIFHIWRKRAKVRQNARRTRPIGPWFGRKRCF